MSQVLHAVVKYSYDYMTSQRHEVLNLYFKMTSCKLQCNSLTQNIECGSDQPHCKGINVLKQSHNVAMGNRSQNHILA